jgi:hypothetical protein
VVDFFDEVSEYCDELAENEFLDVIGTKKS